MRILLAAFKGSSGFRYRAKKLGPTFILFYLLVLAEHSPIAISVKNTTTAKTVLEYNGVIVYFVGNVLVVDTSKDYSDDERPR